MVRHKLHNQGPLESEPLRSWGPFTRYLEIGADKYATRQIDVFENAYALRYDRIHWVDDLGMLADSRYRPKTWERWWGPSISVTEEEFEQVWRSVESSPVWRLQLATAKMGKGMWSPRPTWLPEM